MLDNDYFGEGKVSSMDRVSIYDFCETIANFQTANSFIEYITDEINTEQINRVIKTRKFYSKIGFKKATNVLGHFTNYYFDKFFLLTAIKGMTKQQIEEYGRKFYRDRIKDNLISVTVDRIRLEQEAGYRIIIISASYEPVVKAFCDDYHIDHLIANMFDYDSNDRFTGKIIGKDCIGKNKVKRMNSCLSEYDYTILKSYSDSKSDIPILLAAETGIVISRNRHQKWTEKYGFQEIIWNRE